MKITFILIFIVVISAFSYAIEIQVTFKQLPIIMILVTFALKNLRQVKFCVKTVHHFAMQNLHR